MRFSALWASESSSLQGDNQVVLRKFRRFVIKTGGVRNFVFGHNMSKRCMYANQKETRAAEAPCNPKGAA
ncbi:hypothetical protein ALQ00_200107 [Pseudomonas syringae pv. tomato]|nr:hypothetical protein ALQ00_200107 [Pseudomonas syringae pv. tomato]